MNGYDASVIAEAEGLLRDAEALAGRRDEAKDVRQGLSNRVQALRTVLRAALSMFREAWNAARKASGGKVPVLPPDDEG